MTKSFHPLRAGQTGKVIRAATFGQTAHCETCGKSFVPIKGSTGRFCSWPCMNEAKRPFWLDCSACLAKIGLSAKAACRQLSGKNNRWDINRVWKHHRINPVKPSCGGDWRFFKPASWWIDGEIAALWMSEYRPKFPDWRSLRYTLARSEYWKNREKNDIAFRIKKRIRSRLNKKMRAAINGGRAELVERTVALVGCPMPRLIEWLEARFAKGMSWENYGSYWHIDHIVPCAAFNQLDPRHRAQCWHYTNLQPLEAKKNLEKSDKIVSPQLSLLLSA